MVFPSVPLYLDPPTPWNQQQVVHHHQQQQQQPQPDQTQPDGGLQAALASSIRLNSTAERARLEKIPQPEPSLKCPRCGSTNTKFCYYNNYSLTQPRHFCKACRRYWTRGGALRNVPVGGGCRHKKRSTKSSSSSKPSSATTTSAGPTLPPQQLVPPFNMASLHPMMDYGGGALPNLGLGFSGMQPMDPADNNYQHMRNSNPNMVSEQWIRSNQIQPFSFLGGLEPQLATPTPTPGIYPFDGSAKMEDNHRGNNSASQLYQRNDQFWGGGGNGGEGSSNTVGGGSGVGGWMMNLSGFKTSSTMGDLL